MISIIIPTYNEEKFLPKLLNSIEHQYFKDYEVIVADGNSKDKTRDIAKSYGCKIVQGGNPSRGRNQGASDATGDYFLFLDADVILPRNFLSSAMEEFEKNRYELACAQFIPLSDLYIDHFLYFMANSVLKFSPKFYPFGSGPCMMVTRRLHEAINGFNETLRMAEDHDYVYRAKNLGTYGILNAKIYLSVRRSEKEGRLNLTRKYIYVDAYRLFKGNIKEDLFNYEFGNYSRRKKLSPVEQIFEKVLSEVGSIHKRLLCYKEEIKWYYFYLK